MPTLDLLLFVNINYWSVLLMTKLFLTSLEVLVLFVDRKFAKPEQQRQPERHLASLQPSIVSYALPFTCKVFHEKLPSFKIPRPAYFSKTNKTLSKSVVIQLLNEN